MKTVTSFLTTSALLVALSATAASAQPMNPPQPPPAGSMASGMDNQTAQADAPPATMVTPGEPGTTSDQIAALRHGDNRLVTNGPVPDTAANRAKFGAPMSHAGKKTPPSGN